MRTSMSIRIPHSLSEQLGHLAEVTGRTKSYLAVQAIKDFVDREVANLRNRESVERSGRRRIRHR